MCKIIVYGLLMDHSENFWVLYFEEGSKIPKFETVEKANV